ncbi:MAG: heme NO-binding domain-containing protein [Paracoccaceae bacterium]|nr:heme NO-binding domain-containing protein [Paracoccaceae bacterium]
MHGLINKGLQGFLAETYGRQTWSRIADRANIAPEGFEALLTYDAQVTHDVLDAAVEVLGKPRAVLLEDLGTYLVSHPTTEPVRRLLRFGGLDFSDFMNSLDELPGRARLAVPDLWLPDIQTREVAPDAFAVACYSEFRGFGQILTGLLRAMADDYGALAFIEWEGERGGAEQVSVRLLEGDYSEGRQFDLSRKQAV